MSINYNYELIRDYLDGILDREASNQVKLQIEKDEIARDIAKGILLLNDRFNQDEKKVEKYLEDRLNIQQTAIRQKTIPKKKYRTFKIAASIALLFVSGYAIFNLSQPTLEELIDLQLNTPYSISTTLRSSSDTSIDQAIQNYENKDYLSVYKLLSEENRPQSVFLRGISMLYAGEYSKAIVSLEDKALQTSRYEQQGTWFLALAYLKLGKRDKAVGTLNTIISTPSHYKKKEAEKLLRRLKD